MGQALRAYRYRLQGTWRRWRRNHGFTWKKCPDCSSTQVRKHRQLAFTIYGAEKNEHSYAVSKYCADCNFFFGGTTEVHPNKVREGSYLTHEVN